MKTKYFAICYLLLMNITSCSKTGSSTTSAQQNAVSEDNYLDYKIGNDPSVYFEDIFLKKDLLNNFNINANHDNEISITEASAYNDVIDVSFKMIKSLTGIEKFVNLAALNCANNNIMKLDLSKNINLEYLDCSVNPFVEIDLAQNVKLKSLDITNTKISKLNLSNNSQLIRVVGVCNYLLKSININNNNNKNIRTFNFRLNNILLECIQVDDVDFSANNINWIKPQSAIYSTSCYNLNNPTK